MKTLFSLTALFVASAYFLSSCSDGHDDHGHDHGDHDHEKGDHDHDDHDHKDAAHKDDDHDHKDGDHKHGEDGHTHGPGIETGPNDGRIVNKVEPHFEFLVLDDRKVQITFVKDDNKTVVPPAAQKITVIGGDRGNPTKMNFAKKGNTLVSDIAFPKGQDFPIVIQVKQDADSKAVIEKFNLNLHDCPTCENKEYACKCEH